MSPRRPTADRLLVLNGPAGVGKSTVARALAGTVPNGASIEADLLRSFVVSHDPDRVPRGLGYVNAATVAANFISAGYDLVVVNYVFEAGRHVERFLEHAPRAADVHLITLWASIETVMDRESRRTGRDPLGGRVVTCYETMRANLADLGHLVVTDGIAPDEVARRVLRAVRTGASRLRAAAA